MPSIEQEQDFVYKRQREKPENLRSKRNGRYVSLIDYSVAHDVLSRLSTDSADLSSDTLALVRVFEKRKEREKKERVKRRRAKSLLRRKISGKK